MSNQDMPQLARQTQEIYQRNAFQFANQRPQNLFEKPWLERFRRLMPENGAVLDLGCGAGEPIAAFFLQHGHRLIGLDASANMISLARKNLPAGDWRHGDMRSFDFPDRFDGILGWHSFFHLTREEQRTTLPIIAGHLQPGGALLLTVGPDDGEVTGRVGDDLVYHASLSPDEYSEILSRLGISIKQFVAEDPDCDGATVLLAQKAAI